MNEVVKNSVAFVKSNSRWLLIFVFWMLVLYLNSLYPTKAEFKLLEDNYNALTERVLLFEQAYELEKVGHEKEVATQKIRLDEKVKLIDQHTKDIVDSKIMDARFDERIKHLKLK